MEHSTLMLTRSSADDDEIAGYLLAVIGNPSIQLYINRVSCVIHRDSSGPSTRTITGP
jgi:hypothetical protein